ncbi:hypothetical protein CORC01_07939 [Colletotrichum orchidophilum]|uniref:Uncharacterized protein n=1 Tax=Colletotrichum orchidophilum TaxID=1209926 RepID=A0A1G4B656_9PEZI|nr:uncharacterized protein CORC01_07939 [Colletotrichum orchidophilum]OHE96793.1 hypothetical protein CORC01_07939 [Colletotrichum orchidophilum]
MVLMSILFATFEMMAGNAEAASRHHHRAAAMIEQFVRTPVEGRGRDGVSIEKLSLSELDSALFNTLQRLDTYPWAMGFGAEGIRITAQAQIQHAQHPVKFQYHHRGVAVVAPDATRHHALPPRAAQTSRQHRERNSHRWFQAMKPSSRSTPRTSLLYRDMIGHGARQLARKQALNGPADAGEGE